MLLVNACGFRAASTGLADFVIGSTLPGLNLPLQCSNPALVDGGEYSFAAKNNSGAQYELGKAIWDADNQTFIRSEVYESSNSDAKVAFVGNPQVRITPLAQDLLSIGGGGDIALDDLTDVVATGGSEGDVLTQQSDGSFAMQAPGGGGGSFPAAFTSTINDLKNNPATTTGLTWGYFGGIVTTQVGLSFVTDGTVTLVDDAFNVLAVNPFSGVVEVVNFDRTGVVVIAFVNTSAGAITDTTDARAVLTDSRPLDLVLLNFIGDLPDAVYTPILEPGKVIRDILIAEQSGNAITGGLNIGTTMGGSDILSAFPVPGNSFQAVDHSLILKRAFSHNLSTPIYVSAAGSWNGATLSVTIPLDHAG